MSTINQTPGSCNIVNTTPAAFTTASNTTLNQSISNDIPTS